jgi:CheY-like chemotaxis protein
MKNKTILYVDDDEDDVELLKDLFEQNSLAPQLDAVNNSKEAMDYLKKKIKNLPCFILIDINMPVINGLTLSRIIKDDPELKHLSLALLSTTTNAVYEDLALSLGISIYRKPSSLLEIKQFAEVIVQLCKRL